MSQELDVMLCWFNQTGPMPRAKFTLMHTSNDVKAMIKQVHYKLDINTLHRNEEDLEITMNDNVKVSIRTTKPLMKDAYKKNRFTGSVILVDDSTNKTVAAGMII